jgi:diguanylate cyclase (GGDEF)-like protein
MVAKYFILIFFIAAALLAGAISIFYVIQTKNHLSDIEIRERYSIDLLEKRIAENFESVYSDLKFLSHQNELLQMLSSGEMNLREKIAREYLEFSREKKIYDQIRFLDGKGKEVVRVNYNNGNPVVVPEAKLQHKGNRYYFKDSFTLAEGEVFVSPYDLNVENGRVEEPLKPMIRFGTPVFDGKGRKRGIILLNYLGANLISIIKEVSHTVAWDTLLVNSDGYWLIGPTPESEWGFMIQDRADQKFSTSYREAWHEIAGSEKDQFHIDDGMFTFTTVFPLGEGIKSSAGSARANGTGKDSLSPKEYYWKVISYIPAEVLRSTSGSLLLRLFVLAGILLLITGVSSWVMAQSIVRRNFYQENLWHIANHDSLTGLPNRSMFLDRLKQTLMEAMRYEYQFALLYIDLDGFKSFNDTLGHNAGDLLLRETSKRLTNCLRKSDTASRIGGDEFTVIIPKISSSKNVEVITGKIIESLAEPFLLKSDQKTIGASIGIAVYPEDGTGVEEILKNADTAMYQAKSDHNKKYKFFSKH